MPHSIGRYQVKGEIGSGGMARVFLAFDPRFEREVAIKVLPRDLIDQEDLRTRFSREAKVIASLEHPAIVPVYDFGEDEEQSFLVMRYMRGGNLGDRMQDGPLSLKHIRQILRRMGSALDAAHERGVVHRDVKPANILYDTHDNPHLSDFGIVKIGTQATTLTGEAVIGTPDYMSPEQAQGDRDLDGRTDVYSLGVVLYHLLTGTTPYRADTPLGIAVKHLTEPVPTLRGNRPDLPEPYGEIIQRALAKDPEERFPTAGALSDALEKALQEQAPREATVLGGDARAKRAAGPAKGGERLPAGRNRGPDPMRSTLRADDSGGRRGGGFPLIWILGGLGGIGALGFIAALGYFLLGNRPALSPPPTVEPAETEVEPAAVASPTEVPIPSATPTVEISSPTPPPISIELARSEFDDAELGTPWRWIRESGATWNLSQKPGWLTLWTANATLASEGGNAPVLLRWTVGGDFELITRLDFAPEETFQTAGIIAYGDDDHYVALSRAYCDTRAECRGDGAYLDNDQAATVAGAGDNNIGGLPEGPVLLRLVRRGDIFTGYWSENGDDWQLVAETEARLDAPHLGVYAADGGQGAPSIPGAFDDLELRAPSTDTTVAASAWALTVDPEGGLDVALLGPTSGPGQEAFHAVVQGAELAIEDAALPGGPDLELVIYDGGCSSNGAATAAEEILQNHQVVGVIGPTCSDEVPGALPLFQADKIVAISPSTTVPGVNRHGPDVFNRVILHSQQPGSRGGSEASFLESVQSFYGEVADRTGVDLKANPNRHFAAYGYDATALLLTHVEATMQRSPSNGAVVDRLELMSAVRGTNDYAGITGTIGFEADGDRRP